MFRKLTSMVLAGVMSLSVFAGSAVTAGASQYVDESGGHGDSVVTLDINPRNLKVTVPSVLPIWVDSDNNVTVATNAKIQNRSEGPVDVTDVSVEADNNWSLVDFNTDFTKVPVDTKQYGMTMYNDDVIDGVDLSLFDRIDGSDEIAVVYDGNVAIQSSDINKFDIGHVVFTVAWANGQRLGVNDITYNVENADAASLLAGNEKTEMSVSTNPDRPAYGTLSVPDGATTVRVSSTVDGKYYEEPVSGDEYHVDSLIPGQVYDYQMKDSSGSVIKQGKIYPTGMLRMINGRGNTRNIRDLGGWNADGGRIKYGLVYRGAELNEGSEGISINEAQKAFFVNFLGIRDELDLRSYTDAMGDNIDGIEDSALAPYATWSHANYFNAYANALSFGDYNASKTMVAFNALINDIKEGKPVYIHCAQGADRTATVCCILEALLGMSEDDIDREYEMTLGIYTRYKDNSGWVGLKNRIKQFPGRDLAEKAAFYLFKNGVSYEDLNAVRRIMIDGTPHTLTEPEWSDNVFDKTTATLASRLKSDGSVTALRDGYLVTDYIEVPHYHQFEVESDRSVILTDYYMYCGYDENHNFVGSYSIKTSIADDNKSYTVDTTSTFPVNIKYFRMCIPYNDIDNVVVRVK